MLTKEDMEAMGYEDDMGLSYYAPEDKVKTPLDMVKDFQDIMRQTPDPKLYVTLIKEEFEEWLSELQFFGRSNLSGKEYIPEQELKELTDLLYVIYGYAQSRGWDVMESFERVHKNNVGRCIQPDGSVKRREDGKIVKNKDFPSVDLGDLV